MGTESLKVMTNWDLPIEHGDFTKKTWCFLFGMKHMGIPSELTHEKLGLYRQTWGIMGHISFWDMNLSWGTPEEV